MRESRQAGSKGAIQGDGSSAIPWVAGVAGLLVSIPAIGGGFVWDDRWLILQSPVLRDPGSLPRLLLKGHGWGSIVLIEGGSAYYRPLAMLLHGLLLIIFGAHALPFRLLSSVMHAGTSCVLGQFLKRLSPRAAWGAVLFAAHPVLADAFGWISAAPDILATGFLIGALALLFGTKPRPVLIGVLWILSLSSKESAAIGLLWLGVLWVGMDRSDSASTRRFAVSFAAVAVAAVVYLVLRAAGPGFHPPAGEYPAGVEASGIALVGLLWLVNMMALLFPVSPTLNPPAWAIGSGAGGIGVAGLAVAIAGVAVALWLLLARRDRAVLRMLAIGYLLTITALLPVLQIVKTNDLFGGRFLYLPAAGLCIGIGLAMAARGRSYPRFVQTLFLLLLLAMGIRSGLRASEWTDEARLHGGEFRRRPENIRAQILWASHLMNEGRSAEARPIIEGTIARLPDNPGVRALQAQLWVNEGRIKEAEEVYAGLVRAGRKTPTLLANLAACQMRLGHLEEGIATLDEATRLSNPTPGMRNNRGNALRLLGRNDEARIEFEKAIEEDPAYIPARLNLIFLLAHKIKDGEAARRGAADFVRRFPDESATLRVRALLDSLSAASAGSAN